MGKDLKFSWITQRFSSIYPLLVQGLPWSNCRTNYLALVALLLSAIHTIWKAKNTLVQRDIKPAKESSTHVTREEASWAPSGHSKQGTIILNHLMQYFSPPLTVSITKSQLRLRSADALLWPFPCFGFFSFFVNQCNFTQFSLSAWPLAPLYSLWRAMFLFFPYNSSPLLPYDPSLLITDPEVWHSSKG